MAHSRFQGTTQSNKQKANTSKKEQTRNRVPGEENKNPDTYRNIDEQTKNRGVRTEERNFDILVDGVPYLVRSIPFLFNEELRFRIIINDKTEHVFTWDSEIKMLRAIDDDAARIPDRLEIAISEKLQAVSK